MTTEPRFFGPADAPARPLAGERVAVLGYGNLGRTAALNLRDSGVDVIVGNRDDACAEQARTEGFEVVDIATASAADVIFVLLPDEVIPEVFAESIAPALRPGAAVAFGSGYTLAYDLIAVPPTIDSILVAPRMAGETARQRFTAGQGFWAYIGIEHDASGRARDRMLGLAAGLGSLRAGALEMTATMEATIDLFIEQTVGPLLGTAIMIAFEIGREGGIPAPALVLEMYMSGEFETVFQAFREQGFFAASAVHGPTAMFGGLTRTLELDRAAMAEQFRRVLADIIAGGFAARFQDERAAGYPMIQLATAMTGMNGPMVEAEAAVREVSGTRG